MARIRALVLALHVVAAIVSSVSAARTFRFTVTADSRGERERFRHVLGQIADKVGDEGAFHMAVGDIDPPWDTDADLRAAFGPSVTWYPVVGNHDAETPADMEWIRAFGRNLHGLARRGPPGSEETTYSFDHGGAHFVVLNEYADGSGDTGADGTIGDALLSWLAGDLAAASGRPSFVAGHEPAFPRGAHQGGSLDADPVRRDRFWDLLEEHGVVAYLTAHTHRHSRLRPRGGRVWQVDVGNAGRIRGCEPLTFLDVVVTDTTVRFDVWQGGPGREFSRRDSWTVPVGPDSSPPVPLGARATGDPAVIAVRFDEPLAPGEGRGGAEGLDSWRVAPGAVTEAVLEPDGLSVLLRVDPPMVDGETRAVTVERLADRAVPQHVMDEPWTGRVTHRPASAVLAREGDPWRYMPAPAAGGSDWAEPCFDDSAWTAGVPGPTSRAGQEQVRMRRPFVVGDPGRITGLRLTPAAGTGLVAWVNGVEVARVPPSGTGQGLQAVLAGPTLGAEVRIAASAVPLAAGRNVIAVEVEGLPVDPGGEAWAPRVVLDGDWAAPSPAVPPGVFCAGCGTGQGRGPAAGLEVLAIAAIAVAFRPVRRSPR